MSERVSFLSDGYQIEGILDTKSTAHVTIITHPHPLYGGDMNNTVVDIISRQYQKAGYSTLKFNFRGVGASQGVFDNGVGERNDVLAAYSFLVDQGFSSVNLTGYSFGSWVVVGCANANNVYNNIALISPPASFMSFDAFSSVPNLMLAVVGDQDDFAEKELVKSVISRLNPQTKLEIIAGADHFYFGYADQLESIIHSNIPEI